MIDTDKKSVFLFYRGVNIRNIRSLNINNTYRSANCNVKLRKKPKQILDYHKLTAHTFHLLFEKVKSLKKKKQPFEGLFIGKHHDHEDEAKEKQVALNNFPFEYYSNSTFPMTILLACNENKNAIVYYNYQGVPLTDRELSAIFRASKICRVGIRIPIVLGHFNPILMLFDLFDIRFYVERVEFDFIGLSKDKLKELVPKDDLIYYQKYGNLYYPNTKYRLICYNQTHEVLARYKMQLFLYAESDNQAKVLKHKGLKIANK